MLGNRHQIGFLVLLPLSALVLGCGGASVDGAAEVERESGGGQGPAVTGAADSGVLGDAVEGVVAVRIDPGVGGSAAVGAADRPAGTPARPAAGETEVSVEARPEAAARVVPAGSGIVVRLNEVVSPVHSHAGQAFTATLSDPVPGEDGSALIPAGALLFGRVTAVEPSTRVGQTALVKLAFESIVVGGRTYPLSATVVEANPERRKAKDLLKQLVESGADAEAGPGVAPVAEQGSEASFRAAAMGVAQGTAIAMGTADVVAVLPAGSRMVLRLDAPVRLVQPIRD